MNLLESAFFKDINDSWISLVRRPLRSILSSLGIGIGVAALIAMLSISEGARQTTLKKIESLGVKTLRIESKRLPATGTNVHNLSQGLVRRDCRMLENWLGSRAHTGGFVRLENVSVTARTETTSAVILGVDIGWFSAESLQVRSGRSFVHSDIASHSRYCLVGAALPATLHIQLLSTLRYFGGNFDEPLRVVGIAAKKGRLLTEGTELSALDFDRTIYVPWTTIDGKRNERSSNEALDGIVITFQQAEKEDLPGYGAQVEQLLLAQHHGVRDFEIVIPYRLMEEARASQRTFSLIMGTIAGLSLVVGGIGVLNVMLANIVEQTRDIGLRMAIGATKARILWLYLCHSILLALSGAVWGTLAGVLLALVIQRYAGWEVAFSGMSLLIAPLAALVTGIFFGLHPAIRAADCQPAVALKDM